MKKKLIAVAVAGALGAPAVALAQAGSTVQIYGTIIVNYNYLDRGGNTPKVDMLNAHDANIGFKGEEALGGGLSAWFQCESTADLTGEGSGNGDTHWCGRNSGVGLKGAFGNVWYGIWDTPLKVMAAPLRPFSTSGAYGMGGVMWNEAGSNIGNPVTTTATTTTAVTLAGVTVGTAASTVTTAPAGSARASFTRRQNNTINYYTPNFSGFQAGLAWTSTDEATAQDNATVAAKPRLWGLAATYTNGPLYVGLGYEKHSDYNPAGQTAYTGGNDTGWNIGVAYTFMGKLKASVIYASQEYEVAAGQNLKHDSWGLFGDWNIAGPHRVRAEYVWAGDTKGSSTAAINQYARPCTAVGVCRGDTGASLYSIQYAYGFSKRTEVNFGYSRINNDNNASYRLQTTGSVGATGVDMSAWVLGVKHTF